MRSRFVSLCLLFALLLSGCTLLQKSDSPPEKTQEETAPAPTEEPEEPEPEVPQGPVNPLTGLETGMTENSVSKKTGGRDDQQQLWQPASVGYLPGRCDL